MKALVLKEYKKLALEEMDIPSIGDDDVLIQVKATGICGSDVHGWDGSTGRRQPPIVMGHESAGIITKVGDRVNNWKIGDRVTFDSTIYCGNCWYCKKGQINLCDNRQVLGVSCDEFKRHGAFAEYVSVPERILYKLPDNLSFRNAAMVEPVSIAVHAVERTPVSLNDTVVVVGAGMIGLFVIQVLNKVGCGNIIAVDLENEKLELAKELGASHSFNPKVEDVPSAVQKLTDGRGADISFEVVGINPTINTAINSLRKGGSLTMVGNLSPEITIPLQSVVSRELTLYGSCASKGEYPACLDMIARGDIDVEKIISATGSLEEGESWFTRLYNNEAGLMKVILEPT